MLRSLSKVWFLRSRFFLNFTFVQIQYSYKYLQVNNIMISSIFSLPLQTSQDTYSNTGQAPLLCLFCSRIIWTASSNSVFRLNTFLYKISYTMAERPIHQQPHIRKHTYTIHKQFKNLNANLLHAWELL